MSDVLENELSPQGVLPPPLPKGPSPWRYAWLIAGVIGAMAAITGMAWFAYVHMGSEEFVLNRKQRAALHQAVDLQEWCDFEVDEACETWKGERLFDGSVEISYSYDDPREGAPYLSSSLYYEPKPSDAVMMSAALWQAAKFGHRFSDSKSHVEEKHDLFRWGDASRLGFFMSDNEPYGMIFCARKDRRVYLLVMSGALMEEKEIDAFLRPKLEAAAIVAIDGAKP